MSEAAPRTLPRALVVGALVLGLALLAVVVVRALDRPYTVHAHFYNAGRLVEGGRVEISGRQVGSIEKVALTPDGLADITLDIDDDVKLYDGTRARIRAVGAATLSNNFVDLRLPRGDAAELGDGAVLGLDQTKGIVDFDAILSSVDPATRGDIQDLIAGSASVYAGSGARAFNSMLAKFDPALREVAGVAEELASDRAQVRRLVSTAAVAAKAIGSRRTDLTAAVDNTARSLNAIAAQRDALSDDLARAPAVLEQGGATLTDLAAAVTELRPTLREVPAVAEAADPFLGRLTHSLHQATPVVGQVRAQLPGLRAALDDFPALERPAVAGLGSTGTALRDLGPILRGTRIYGSDLLLGIFNGLVAISTGNFNKYGHYVHLAFSEPAEAFLGGPFQQLLPPSGNLIPGFFGLQTGTTARCPGAAAPPAPDLSSPWVPDRSLCDPADSVPASVNTP